MGTYDNYKVFFPKLSNDFELRDNQKIIIDSVLSHVNSLAIIPTGGGKSIIYWISGIYLKGITIVISPLIALIEEQAQKLKENGHEVLTLHSGLSSKEQIKVLTKLYNHELNPKFIFVSPERIATDGYFEFVLKSRSKDIKLITIDEAHCISQWGFDFRPFYKRIPHFIESVFSNNKPIVLALTATINPKDIEEIKNDFHLSYIYRNEYLLRKEIEIKQIRFTDENEKEEKLWQLLEIHKSEKTIVYLYRKYNKRGTEDLLQKALAKGFNATNFHGDMSAEERLKIINDFKDGKFSLIIATNAFGMGIDIPDIRVIIHYMVPESVEQYYQEIGRAGRDQKASSAYILYTNKNFSVRRSHFIDKSFPTYDELQKAFKKITNNKVGIKTLQYFEDEDVQKCFPYFIENGLISIKTKGFSNLNVFSNIEDERLLELFKLTEFKSIISTVYKSKLNSNEITDLVYNLIANKKVKLSKALDKCLIIENYQEYLSEEQMTAILNSISNKKIYKYSLLDYLKYILDESNNSKELHQEIGVYLGMDRNSLNNIFSTKKGDLVRSKSEVIIANLLFSEGINYEYEKQLFFNGSKSILPDFTIYINNKIFYWEHLGMIGLEFYDKRWLEKKAIYEHYFPKNLITTFESSILTDSVMDIISKLKAQQQK